MKVNTVSEVKRVATTAESYGEDNLAKLPPDWFSIRLGEAIRYEKGRKPPQLITVPQVGSKPYLTADLLRTGVSTQYVPQDVLEACVTCSTSDPVLIWDGSNAGDVFEGVEGVIASTMVRILPDETKLLRPFCRAFLQTKFSVLNGRTTGSTIPHVNKALFEDLRVPLPSLAEQKAITRVLATIESAKETTEHVIAAARQLKASLLKHLFTYGPIGIEESGSVEVTETSWGFFPSSWPLVRLGELVELRNGTSYGPKDWREDGVPIIRIQNLKDRTTPFNYYQGDLTGKVVVDDGDLLFSWSGSKGTSFGPHVYRGVRGVLNQHIFKVTIRKRDLLDPPYLYYALLRLTASIEEKAYGLAALVHVRKGDLEATQIPVPTIDVQRQITSTLSAVDEKLGAEEMRQKSLQRLLDVLLHQMMTGAVRLPEFVTSP